MSGKLLYRGKTKDVYEDGPETVRLAFTDRVTENLQGEVDPGGNQVSEKLLPGTGLACLAMTAAAFAELAGQGFPTHMVSYDLGARSMVVRKAKPLGAGLEWVARWVGTGSFVRRFKSVPGVRDGMRFPSLVTEITIKDDAGQDPMIDPSAVVALGILTRQEMDELAALNRRVMQAIHAMFAARGLDLWDIKVEWGRDAATGALMLIDEVSANGCRAFDAVTGKKVAGAELSARFQK